MDAYANANVTTGLSVKEEEFAPYEDFPEFTMRRLCIGGEPVPGFMGAEGPVIHLGRLTTPVRQALLAKGSVELEDGHFPSSGTLEEGDLPVLQGQIPDGVQVRRIYFG